MWDQNTSANTRTYSETAQAFTLKQLQNTLTLHQTIKFWTDPNPNLKHLQMIKIYVGKNLKTVYGRVKNIVKKGENAGYLTECSVSYCDHSPSVVVRPTSVRPQFAC